MRKSVILFLFIFSSAVLNAQTWTALSSGTTNHCLDVSTPSPSLCYVSVNDGTVLKTIDGGTSWNSQTTGTAESLYSINFTDDNTGYAVGDNKTALKTIDGGTTWTSMSLVPASPVFHFRHINLLMIIRDMQVDQHTKSVQV